MRLVGVNAPILAHTILYGIRKMSFITSCMSLYGMSMENTLEGVNAPIPAHTILRGIQIIRHLLHHAYPYMEYRWKTYFLRGREIKVCYVIL